MSKMDARLHLCIRRMFRIYRLLKSVDIQKAEEVLVRFEFVHKRKGRKRCSF